MKFTYCPDCGSRLSARELGDEGMVPWCDKCEKPWFDSFSTCVIALVTNERDEVLLERQAYISTKYCNLVSGYMTPGETAEEAARREIKEETGLDLECLELVGTWWFERKGLLMVGFIARALPGQELKLSTEVDSAEWQPAEVALTMVHPAGNGSTSNALTSIFCERLRRGLPAVMPKSDDRVC
jgi:NAD+ diphosphatase